MKHLMTTLAVLIAASAAVRADGIRVDAAKIYYGTKEGEKPATVRAADCFAVIPEWQEIQRRKLTSSDADYWVLLSAANSKFRKAVEAVARSKGNDMVAEQGSISVKDGDAAPPDVTTDVVDTLKNAAGDSK